MKYFLSVLITALVCVAVGWFVLSQGKKLFPSFDWFKADTVKLELSAEELNALKAEIESTLKPSRVDTLYEDRVEYVPRIPKGYVPSDSVRTKVIIDTVYERGSEIISTFKDQIPDLLRKRNIFSVSILAHAQCKVDSIDTKYTRNLDYWRDYADEYYRKGYAQGKREYPTWKKVAYAASGALSVGVLTWMVK